VHPRARDAWSARLVRARGPIASRIRRSPARSMGFGVSARVYSRAVDLRRPAIGVRPAR
jgi:hypothetical protein